jgi:hypothetical protein
MTVSSAPAYQNDTATPADDREACRASVRELMEMGMDLARLVHAQARTQLDTPPAPDAGPAPDGTVAFDRIARAVRRTAMLLQRLNEPAASLGEQQRAAARRRIIRGMEDRIQRNVGPAEADRMYAELMERMDSPDLEDELLDRPVADIILDIARDFGIEASPGTHPWKRRTPADIAELRERAAMPPPNLRTITGPGARWPGPGQPDRIGPSSRAPPPSAP